VLVPASVWTICKAGGSYNSLLPAYLPMTALFVARLDVTARWLQAMAMPREGLAAGAIGLAIIFSMLIQFDRVLALLSVRHGDDKDDAAVALTREYHAITPQDPTIAYRANKYFGCSLFFELDTHALNGNWPEELPMSILEELRDTAAVIAVHSYVPTPVFERGLRDNGFHPAPVAALDGSAYTLWTKTNR
jgi:hypothetical protein